MYIPVRSAGGGLHSIIAFVDIQRWRGFSAWGAAILAAGGRRWNGGPTAWGAAILAAVATIYWGQTLVRYSSDPQQF